MSTSRLLFPWEGLGWDKIEPFLSEMALGDERCGEGRVPLYAFKATDSAYDVCCDEYFKFCA